MPVAQSVKGLALRDLGFGVEIAIKRTARDNDAEVLVEDEQGFTYRVYNRLSKRVGGLDPPRWGG